MRHAHPATKIAIAFAIAGPARVPRSPDVAGDHDLDATAPQAPRGGSDVAAGGDDQPWSARAPASRLGPDRSRFEV
jgi:hypothetical protein